MSGNFVSYQDADALMTKIAQKISGGGGGTDKAILYYMTDNAMYDGYHVRATGLLSGTVYNTVLDSEGNGDVEVEGMERYSIDFYYIDENEQEVSVYQTDVDAHTGHFFYIPLGYDKTSWQGIQNILDAHKETELLEIGDELHTNVGGVDTVFQIAAIDLYESHEVIFIAKSCILVMGQHTAAVNSGGWSSSDIRTYLNGTFKTGLEDAIRNNLKLITFRSGGGNSNTLINTDDYIWIPREYEVFGERIVGSTNEPRVCRQYPILSTPAQRIKTYNGVARGWWDASAASTNNFGFGYVSSVGNAPSENTNANHAYGVVPCFHFTANR